MGIELLPAVEPSEDPWGEARPVRPNLPMLRWFSFTKWHAIQLGFFIGAFVYFAWRSGRLGMALTMISMIVKYVLDHRKVKDDGEACDHKAGFHDVVKKPHYFGTVLLTTTGGAWVVDTFLLAL